MVDLTDSTVGFQVPRSCPGVPAEVLDPRRTGGDEAAYDVAAARLARRSAANFGQYADQATPEAAGAGPRTG